MAKVMGRTEGTAVGTLLKALTSATGLSRRKAFSAIREGRVTVAGKPATDPSAPYAGGEIALEGLTVDASPAAHVYLMLNKPAGFISASSDPHGRPTVLALVPVELRLPGLHPVGRLDQDTTGLLLLTNDGDFTFRMTHPSQEVEKEYWLNSRPALSDNAMSRLTSGVEIDGELRLPHAMRRLLPETGFETSITIREGRKRQVRRMVEAVGARVTALRRVREGPLTLGDLDEGKVRVLTARELKALGPTASAESKRPARPAAASKSRPARKQPSGPPGRRTGQQRLQGL